MKGMMDDANTELQQRLLEGKTVQIIPQGISMLPFIQGGQDKVLVSKVGEVSVGDIVLAPYGGSLILHRIYAVAGDKIILMGDGNLKGNEVVDKLEIWGKVTRILKPNGRCRQPNHAWFWRHTLPFRKYLLKLCRKWNKFWNRDLTSKN